MNKRQQFLADIAIARPQTFSKMEGVYNEPPKPAVRIGADDHAKHPSRDGTKLHYMDGSVKSVK